MGSAFKAFMTCLDLTIAAVGGIMLETLQRFRWQGPEGSFDHAHDHGGDSRFQDN